MADEKQVVKSFSVTYEVTMRVDVERTPENLEELFQLRPTCEARLTSNPFEQYEKFLDKDNRPISLLDSDFDLQKNPDFVVNFIRRYILDEMENELCRASESLYQEAYFQGTRGKQREKLIKDLREKTEKAIRKRLEVPTGKIPARQTGAFLNNKEEFIKKAFEIFDELQTRNKEPYQTGLTDVMYPDHKNPLLALRRKLKDFDLNFPELVEMYRTEHKRP